MGKVHMFHPSSARENFDTVSNQTVTDTGATQTASNTNNNQTSQPINQNVDQTVNKKEVEEKTKDAIKAATIPKN